MLSKSFIAVPDYILARMAEGTADDAEAAKVSASVSNTADLWALCHISLRSGHNRLEPPRRLRLPEKAAGHKF